MGMLSGLLEHQSCGTCHLQAPEKAKHTGASTQSQTMPLLPSETLLLLQFPGLFVWICWHLVLTIR